MTAPALICGPNGAGKTTFARRLLPLLPPGVPYLNVDEIQREADALLPPLPQHASSFGALEQPSWFAQVLLYKLRSHPDGFTLTFSAGKDSDTA